MFKKMGRKVCVFALAGIMTLNIGMQTTFAYSNIPAKLSLENTANLLEKNADKEKEKYVKGELIVKYKSTKTDKGKVKDKIKKSLKKKSVVPQEKEELSSVIDVLEVDENEDIDSLAKSISEDPDVEFAQPNYIYYASAIPQDERYSEQWSLKNPSTGFDINAEKAWDITRGSSNVVVAVLDTGIAIGHPDLAGNIYVNPDEIIDNDDNDGNDKDDDLNGWDFVNDDNTVYDLNDKTHGTHVAGTIAASANNIGVSGVAPNVKILPLKVLGTDGRGNTSGLVKAIEYAASKGAEIVNMSLGGPDYDPALIDIMNRNPQTLFVVAAGNDHCDLSKVPTYPASHDLPNMLVVASVDPNGSMSSYSNYGDAVDVAAPGRDILSTVASYENENIEYSYGLLDGTSMAAPHVTGVAALVKSRYPDADAAEIINRIKGSASINEDIKNWVPGGLMLDAYGSINNLGSIDFTVSKASENEIYLEWMPVPGAASYKCSVGYDGSFITINTYLTAYSLEAGKTYAFRVAALDAWGNEIAESRFMKSTLSEGTGTGLKANYFNDAGMNELKVKRNENIDFNWGSGSPDASINNENFSVIWNGEIEPRYSEDYTLYVQSSGACKVWVDGNLIINRATDDSSMVELSGNLNLNAGEHYPIQVEYYETNGDASIKLLWSSASQDKEVVPASRLYETSIISGIWSRTDESEYGSAFNNTFAMVEGGKLYVLSCEVLGDAYIEVYDELQNKFVRLTQMKAKLINGATAIVSPYFGATSLNGKIYTFISWEDGLNDNAPYAAVQEYDIATGTVTNKNFVYGLALPLFDTAITVNGQIYVFGGSNNSNVYVYDPEADTWTAVAQMPDNRDCYAIAQCDGKVYLMGGQIGTENLSSVYMFDPQNNSWTRKADMIDPLTYGCAAEKNGKILVYGGYAGYTERSRFTRNGYAYDPANDEWSTIPSLISPRGHFGMENLGGRIFAVYGMNVDSAFYGFDVLEDRYAATYKISGYITPDYPNPLPQTKEGFKVSIKEIGKYAVTDQNGYFEITGVPSNVDGYMLKIEKDQYLTRQVNVKVKASDVQIGTEASPVDMWTGDVDSNNAINMKDTVEISSCFSAIRGDEKYRPECDLNMDGVINIADVNIVSRHFNATPGSYPEIF